MNPILKEIQSPYAGRDKAIENMGGLTALYEKHLTKFRENYRTCAHTLENLLTSGDYENARILAHSIKGLAGTLGLTRLYYAAADLELSIKNNTDPLTEELPIFCTCLSEVL